MPYLVRKQIDGSIADRWELSDKELIAGRGEKAEIRAHDPEMSRQHFKITSSTIQDLGSRNGTFVNGQKISAATPLKPHDQIRSGETHFVFTTDAQPEAMPTLTDVHKPKVLKKA